MATPRVKTVSVPNPDVSGFRRYFRHQSGWNGDHKQTYGYDTNHERVSGSCYNPFTGFRAAYDAGNAPGQVVVPWNKRQAAFNQAYGLLQHRLRGTTSQLGNTFGEFKSSARMVRGRAEAIWSTFSSLNRQWKRRRRRSKSFRKRFKYFSDYWLEYSFGLAPLFGDLFAAFSVLCGDCPSLPSSFGIGFCEHEGTSGSGNPRHVFSYTYKVKAFATMKVTNPNTYLLANLGLLNPVGVLWELTKWSFVVDWIADVGSMIGSWSDNFGVDYINAGVSHKQFGTTTQTWNVLLGSSKSTSLVAQRNLGLSMPLPNLAVLSNIGTSLKRAANAIALTLQLIGKR